MSRYPFVIVDVFTDCPFSGNQLAVVFEADPLTTARMQAIAAEFGFSESTFVQRASGDDHDWRVRIFTPRSELPFAGHPTVGTALALAWHGDLPAGAAQVVLGEGAGPVPVALRHEHGRAVAAEFQAPGALTRGRRVEAARCAAALGLTPADIEDDPDLPGVASHGVRFLLVPLASRAALARAAVRDLGLFDGLEATGVCLFTRDVGEADADLRVRMFAPLEGIAEDPATGSAAAALAGCLGSRAEGDGLRRWRILQGVEMGRPSRIEASARVSGGRVDEVRVGGAAVQVAEGTITAPAA